MLGVPFLAESPDYVGTTLEPDLGNSNVGKQSESLPAVGFFVEGRTVQIKINGTIDEMPDDATISDVLASRTLREEMAIVLVNGEVTRREEWGASN